MLCTLEEENEEAAIVGNKPYQCQAKPSQTESKKENKNNSNKTTGPSIPLNRDTNAVNGIYLTKLGNICTFCFRLSLIFENLGSGSGTGLDLYGQHISVMPVTWQPWKQQ